MSLLTSFSTLLCEAPLGIAIKATYKGQPALDSFFPMELYFAVQCFHIADLCHSCAVLSRGAEMFSDNGDLFYHQMLICVSTFKPT